MRQDNLTGLPLNETLLRRLVSLGIGYYTGGLREDLAIAKAIRTLANDFHYSCVGEGCPECDGRGHIPAQERRGKA